MLTARVAFQDIRAYIRIDDTAISHPRGRADGRGPAGRLGHLQSLHHKDWSYVDCSMLALARRLEVNVVFAFDRHFDQMLAMTRLPT